MGRRKAPEVLPGLCACRQGTFEDGRNFHVAFALFRLRFFAEDREVVQPGDRVAFLGIGSGLNCLMLGVEW